MEFNSAWLKQHSISGADSLTFNEESGKRSSNECIPSPRPPFTQPSVFSLTDSISKPLARRRREQVSTLEWPLTGSLSNPLSIPSGPSWVTRVSVFPSQAFLAHHPSSETSMADDHPNSPLACIPGSTWDTLWLSSGPWILSKTSIKYMGMSGLTLGCSQKLWAGVILCAGSINRILIPMRVI